MRRLGIAILGLFCGLLVGFVANELIAVVIVAVTGSLALTTVGIVLLRATIPVLGVLGVLVALAIDRRRQGMSKGGR